MADLSCFATKDNAEEGVIFPVKIKGTKFPIAIKIYGSDSDAVKFYERKLVKNLNLFGGKDKDNSDELEEYLSSDEGVVIRIGGLWSYNWDKQEIDEKDPVILFGKTLGCDKKSYEFLVDKIPAIKDFITEKSNDRSNFLSEGKKN